MELAQELTINKNPYFRSDQADILVILPTHELSTLTVSLQWGKIVDFLVMG